VAQLLLVRPMSIRSFVRALVVLLFSCLAACEYGPPAIANAYPQPATFRVSFAEGALFEGTLSQGTILWQPQKGRHVSSVTITTASGSRRDYPSPALQRLREQRHIREELWIFGISGVRLEDAHDTKRIRKELPPPKA
jgi:hypothetical protein